MTRLLAAIALTALATTAQAQPNNWPASPTNLATNIPGNIPGAHVVGRRPHGCPRRFCGCGLSLKLFGKIIPRLNLAANWITAFPRERGPRSGLVAARRGHVMLLIKPASAGRWVVFDPNSGGGLTRIHVRPVRGFVFVNPHGSQVAEMR